MADDGTILPFRMMPSANWVTIATSFSWELYHVIRTFSELWCLKVCLFLLVLAPNLSVADEKPVSIRPEQARQYDGKVVAVTMTVKSSKDARDHRKVVFLDSEVDFTDEKNLGVTINLRGLNDLEKSQGIAAPDQHFMGKRVRITGKVVIRDGRPYIDIQEAKQIELVSDKD